MDNYQPVIGLEIHVELKTKAKMFCQCPADYFGRPPNSQTCPVCLGLPGALPVPNQKAVAYTHLIGRALNCCLNQTSKFDRKHYFYPDLPKGYQISQYDQPLCSDGKIKFHGSDSWHRIRRVHIEEDTGKLIHQGNETLIDFNRSGVPLMEIVTEADFATSDDVKIFLEQLQMLIRDLEVSDADMEKGSMRFEPNISIQDTENQLPSYKVEVKNINSFRFVKQAIDHEIKRQIEILAKGETPAQETRGFDENKSVTHSQRIKEEAHDYRYFPEPDIPPMSFDQTSIQKIEDSLRSKSTFDNRRTFLIDKCKLNNENAFIIAMDRGKFLFFTACLPLVDEEIIPKMANIIVNKPQLMQGVSSAIFVEKAQKMFRLKPIDDNQLAQVIGKVLIDNPKAVEDYKKGKQNAVNVLVGQVMKEMKGQADAQSVRKKIEEKLK